MSGSVRRPRGSLSAADRMAELANDRDYQARKATVDAEMARRKRAVREAEEPVLSDLSRLGLHLDSVWDLYEHRPYPEGTFGVLLRHLDTELPDLVREGIARAFSVPEARPSWSELVRRYRSEPSPLDSNTRQGLAATLMTLADKQVKDDVLELLRDRTLGSSRVLLMRSLTRMRLPDRWNLIEGLSHDPALRAEAEHMIHQRALRKGE